jgi:predicted  nucleic acid-binding Zn-ribbon protein
MKISDLIKPRRGQQEAIYGKINEARAQLEGARTEADQAATAVVELDGQLEELSVLVEAGEITEKDGTAPRARIESQLAKAWERSRAANENVRRLERTIAVLQERATEAVAEEGARRSEAARKEISAQAERMRASILEAAQANYALQKAAMELHAAGGDPYARALNLVLREIMPEQVDRDLNPIRGAAANSEFVRWMERARAQGFIK